MKENIINRVELWEAINKKSMNKRQSTQGGNAKMMTKILILGLIAVMTFAGGTLYAKEESSQKARALFNAKCSLCHSIERPMSKKKSPDAWRSTVMRMKNVNGAPITDEEANAIVEYLSEHFGK